MKKVTTYFFKCIVGLLLISISYNAKSQSVDFLNAEKAFSSNVVSTAHLLTIDEVKYEAFRDNAPTSFQLKIPIDQSSYFTVDLVENDIFADNFVITSTDGNKVVNVPFTKGLYYKGTVQGNANSMIAISFFENEIMGLVSTSAGDYVIGSFDNSKVTGNKSGQTKSINPTTHLIYNDQNLLVSHNFECSTDDVAHAVGAALPNIASPPPPNGSSSSALPVKIYFEADYDLYLNKNSSTTDVTNYVTGLFNSVATLYATMTTPVVVQISQIQIWTAVDPYPNSSSGAALDAFAQNIQNTFNGDLAHLLSTASGNNGGLAWVGVLCASYNSTSFSGPYAYSNISTTYSNYPTFSWSVEVVTHEMGHNLGSSHTHSCVWNGNSTQIDDCGNQYSPGSAGACYNSASAIIPTSGTIMSYCHLVSGVGIDFANGFNSQVQTVINNHIAGASCLTGGQTLTCTSPITTFPSTENFSTATLCNTAGSCIADQTCASAVPTGWLNDSGDNTDWSIETGATTSSMTGPTTGYGGSGQYMYIEASSGCSANEANLISPCYNLTNISSSAEPKLSFAYHMYGVNMGSLAVDVSDDLGSTWTTLWSISGNQGNDWHTKTVCLDAYANSTIHIRFRGMTGSGYESDIAIDEIVVDDFNANASLATATLTAPANSATNVTYNSPITFNWTHNQGANVDSMRLQISKVSSTGVSYFTEDGWQCGSLNNAGGDLVVNTNMVTVSNGQGSFTWNAADPNNGIAFAPQPNTTYYWTVRYNVPGTGHSYYSSTYSFTTDGTSGCTSTNQYPAGTFTPTTSWQTTSNLIYAGEYSLYNVVSGTSYSWSLCSADGGSASYDSELTLLKNSDGSFLDYSNDDCGDDAIITWTATFTGVVKVVVTEYNCLANSTNTTLVYKDNTVVTPTGCNSTTLFPTTTFTPTTAWQTTASNIYAGEYSLYNVVSGESYSWSLCSADGGSASYDSELTLRKNSDDSFLAYSNDDCGDDAIITWTATFTGVVKVVVTEYSCLTNSTNTTLVYRDNGITYCPPPTTPVTLPFTENFESLTNGSFGEGQVYCGTTYAWDLETSDASCRALVGTSAFSTNGGTGAVTLDRTPNGTVETNDFILTVNLSNYTANTNLELAFDFAQHGEESHANDRVWIRGSNTDTWLEIYDWYANKAANDVYVNVTGLDIDALLSANSQSPSATFQVRFGQEDNYPSGSGDGLTVDNVVISTTATAPLAISNTSINVDCNGGSNGSIDITVTGGLAPFTYAWNNTATTEDLTNIGAGVYSCVVTDALNNTISTGNIIITEPAAITSSSIITNASCNGGNGLIDLSVGGGISGYTYLWSNNSTTQDLTAGAGTYSVTITDANNCTKAVTGLTITEPTAIVGTTSITNATCNGGTGSIDLTVTGGGSGYSYVWSNTAITQDLINVVAGTYSVTVTDVNNCSKVYSNITIGQPTAITTSTSVTDISCNGAADGTINLSVSGGTGSYSYNWNNTATTQDLSNLATGIYAVTITDTNNCTSTVSNLTINEPSAISVTNVITNVSCNGMADGSINLTASGGAGGYTYLWSNNTTGSSLSGVGTGTYSVTITDVNNCTKTITNLTITEPAALQLTAALNQHACNGNDGSINVAPSGGTAPYTIQPSGLGMLFPGTYTVTLTDANGCTDVSSPIEVVGSPIAAFGTSITDTQVDFTNQSTFGDTYSWDFGDGNSSTAENPTHIYAASGVYTVTLTITNACGSNTSTTTVEVIAVDAYDVLSEDLLKIFPNPAKAFLQLEHQLTGSWSLEMYNAIGQSVLVQANIKHNETLDISNLPTGTYFIRIFNEEKGTNIRKKIQVLK